MNTMKMRVKYAFFHKVQLADYRAIVLYLKSHFWFNGFIWRVINRNGISSSLFWHLSPSVRPNEA